MQFTPALLFHALTSAERAKNPESAKFIVRGSSYRSPLSSGTAQRKAWWETLTNVSMSRLCGMFFLVLSATTERTEVESSMGRGWGGWVRALGLS